MDIFSDCKSALEFLKGRYKGSFLNMLSGWKLPVNCALSKVKAHPEKYRAVSDWTDGDKGIWMADQIAGKALKGAKMVRASEWLKRISVGSKVTVIDQGGLPFVKDIAKRWSNLLVSKYFKERDDYREGRGVPRKWEGTNMSFSHKMMGRNKSVADRSAVQRAALDKRWRWHWAREDDICSICMRKCEGILHPIRHCTHEIVSDLRDRLTFRVRGIIDSVKAVYRAPLEELWRNMEVAKDGEYACCGVFTPTFLKGLTRSDHDVDKNERAAILKVLKVIGAGTRDILRAHAEADHVGNAIHLNQMSITSFFSPLPTAGNEDDSKKNSKKKNKKNRKKREVKYVNPGDAPDGSDDEEETPRIINPPSYISVFRQHITTVRQGHLEDDSVVYWEWKAG